ncbi:hypothetical protein SKAU_G00107120 [Synaphobranchus kaupii]|uniref:Uncharacterized protein n=1 Tax=Synaphobranchus kaupii TaxID=118154 RepID=A0A9Q1J7P7_SYNKA|nr:hypothetical protein SKAU_G00107120 [Synaphobranchus kaupii]
MQPHIELRKGSGGALRTAAPTAGRGGRAGGRASATLPGYDKEWRLPPDRKCCSPRPQREGPGAPPRLPPPLLRGARPRNEPPVRGKPPAVTTSSMVPVFTTEWLDPGGNRARLSVLTLPQASRRGPDASVFSSAFDPLESVTRGSVIRSARGSRLRGRSCGVV